MLMKWFFHLTCVAMEESKTNACMEIKNLRSRLRTPIFPSKRCVVVLVGVYLLFDSIMPSACLPSCCFLSVSFLSLVCVWLCFLGCVSVSSCLPLYVDQWGSCTGACGWWVGGCSVRWMQKWVSHVNENLDRARDKDSRFCSPSPRHSCCIPIYSFGFPVSDCPRTTCTQLCVH